MIRGGINQIHLFEQFANTHMWDFVRINLKTKKKEHLLVQGNLRKSILGTYEYIFPQEHLAEVLTMFGVRTDKKSQWKIGGFKGAALRKMIGHGVKPIPKYKPVDNLRYVELRGIALYPIGIKYDEIRDSEAFGYHQEML